MATAKPKAAGLVASCDDHRLLAFPLWERQRELLEAVESGPRLHVWALGRRSGKTTLAALVGLWDCLLRPELGDRVRRGERRHAVAVATSIRQARLFVLAAVSIVEASPMLKSMIETVDEDCIMFKNGTALSAFPCTARGVRGWPISTLLLDEAAHFVSETDGPAVAERVFASLVPATAQFGDDARIIVASTPYGTSGFFAELFAQSAGGELDDAVGQRFTTAEMNPTIDADFLGRERARDPENFRSEYLAEFVGSGGAYLDAALIDDAVVDRRELPANACTGWVAGLDPAFSSDPFGLAIVGRSRDDRDRLVLGLAQAWTPTRRAVSFKEKREHEDEVLEQVAAVCRAYNVRHVATDQYAADAVVERLRSYGLVVRCVPMSATSKTAIFAELRARLVARQVELYDAPGLVPELRRLRSKFTTGSASVVNPRVGGSHGDLAQALALAVHEHRRTPVSDDAAHVGVGGEHWDSLGDGYGSISYDDKL